MQYSIDSGPLQPVVYGDARADIAGGFAGFSNTAAAGGHAIIDWSTLTNGPHTIGWLITDDCNRADGVGSRFFNVTTGTSLTVADADFRLMADATGESGGPPASVVSALRRDDLPESDAAITVARGYGELPEVIEPAPDGSRTIEITQGEPIEVRLPRGHVDASQLGPDGQPRALPIGSTWDAASGTSSWQPAPGCLGSFHMAFSHERERIIVRDVVKP